MKFISLLIAASISIAAVSAQAKTLQKPPKVAKVFHCPIMKKNKVDITKATKAGLYADYKGRRYFFCCGSCPSLFKANPEKYKGADSIPAPKSK